MKINNKDFYNFDDMDDLEENIKRIIYMFRRYKGIRAVDGKHYSKLELAELSHRISRLFISPKDFDWDTGIVLSDEDYKEHYGYERVRTKETPKKKRVTDVIEEFSVYLQEKLDNSKNGALTNFQGEEVEVTGICLITLGNGCQQEAKLTTKKYKDPDENEN